MKLTPRNRAIGEFTFGSWSWSYLLDLAGPVFPGFWSKGARWYMVMGDPRFKDGDYPEVLGDSGRHFYVRADEARHLARVARSWAVIQAHLPGEARLAASLPGEGASRLAAAVPRIRRLGRA